MDLHDIGPARDAHGTLASLTRYIGEEADRTLVDALRPFERRLGAGGSGTRRALLRYALDQPDATDRDHGAFLERLLGLCFRDAYLEASGTGADASGALLPEEVAAAAGGLRLPRGYFQRRPWMDPATVRGVLDCYRMLAAG